MLEFWILKPDEGVEFVDGAIKDPPDRHSEFSIGLSAFHRIMEIGLRKIASDVGLSYFSDTLIDLESSEKLLAALLKIDAELNPAGARTETRAMAEFFSRASDLQRKVVVVCD